MSDHYGVLKKRIMAHVLKQGPDKRKAPVQKRPASFAYFTIADLQHIINQIQLYPFKQEHLFLIEGSQILITLYVPETEETSTGDPLPSEGFVPASDQ